MAATIEPQMHEPTTGKKSTSIHHQLGLGTTLKSFTMLLLLGGEGDNACEPSEVILGNSIARAEEKKCSS
jgi:hypothetical protein